MFSKHIRSNILGLVAIFIALGGTAYATHPDGANTISTGDIQDGQVQNADLGPSAVTGDKVFPSTLTGSDVASSSLTGSDIATDSLSSSDVGANAVGTSELAQLPGARAFANTVQTIPNNGAATLDLDLETFDTGGIYAPDSDSITVSLAGTYMLSGEVAFDGDPHGQRIADIRVDGSPVAWTTAAGTSPNPTRVPVSTIARLNAGDVVTLRAVHNAGNSLATHVFGGSGLGTGYLAVQWLSD